MERLAYTEISLLPPARPYADHGPPCEGKETLFSTSHPVSCLTSILLNSPPRFNQ